MADNKLDAVFKDGKKNLLNVYCTAGYPELNSTGAVMQALQEAGVDMIEIGMPYSDPIADGPVIQESNMIALKNGMNMHIMFDQLTDIKQQINIPIILMGYFNPVLQYGVEEFCKQASSAGVSAVIIPDLPTFEYKNFYKKLFKKYNLHFIFLVSPGTSEKRLKESDNLSRGFLYAVSSSSTTGQTSGTIDSEYLSSLQKGKLKNPIMIGFGIKDKSSFQQACRYANGAIIGSAYIKALKNSSDIYTSTRTFISSITD